jgi:ABC-type multidrug transport system fused ATPase/permease subunit
MSCNREYEAFFSVCSQAVERLENSVEDDKEVLADTTDSLGSVVKFNFPDPGPLSPPIVAIDDVTFSYNEKSQKPLLRNVNFGLDMSSRIGILGTYLLTNLLGRLHTFMAMLMQAPMA